MPTTTKKPSDVRRLPAYALLTALALAGCGGGGGDSAPPVPLPPPGGQNSPSVPWTSGVFQPHSGLKAQCAIPRTGADPLTGAPYPDVQGSAAAEKNWLRSWTNDLYLWYREVPDIDPNGAHSPAAYFDLMKTFATESGQPKDRFHFTAPTAEWIQLAQSGVSVDYGAQWVVSGAPPSRELTVAYMHPDTPAGRANLVRGTKVLAIDGISIATANTQLQIDALNAALSPSAAGEAHDFLVQRPGLGTAVVSLQAETITMDPVQHVRTIDGSLGKVGYFFFTDHIATAEGELVDAIQTLRDAAVTDLVVDLRYNGGGFLAIASELAYMIAGPAQTGGRTFEALRFNDRHPSTNPVTGQPLIPVPFYTVTSTGIQLPTLDLARVFVITGSGTCSASEAIINGLRGVGVEVIQIGSTTCGKPYGFYPADNCGTTYFSIQFQGVNALGFGDYGLGFSPANGPSSGARLRGCPVADDLTHELGDPLEHRLAAALAYRETGTCPAPAVTTGLGLSKLSAADALRDDGLVPKSPWLQNRILSDH